jgi:hypothetical protein
VSIGHIISLDSLQNGQVKPCGTSFTLLYGPETLNVFWHLVQVTIFSILNSLLLLGSTGLSGIPGGGGHAARLNSRHLRHEHLKSRSSGITTWPHCSQMNQAGRCNSGLKSSSKTQSGQRTTSAILSLFPAGLGSFAGVGLTFLGLVFELGPFHSVLSACILCRPPA